MGAAAAGEGGRHPHPDLAGAQSPPRKGRGGEGSLMAEAGAEVFVAGGATTTFEERTTWDLSAVSPVHVHGSSIPRTTVVVEGLGFDK